DRKVDGACQIEKAMEKMESEKPLSTFPQPRLLRNTLSHGIRIQGARPKGEIPAYPWGDGMRKIWRFKISQLDEWMKRKGFNEKEAYE
ncbi:MAG TPA: hypothetical protein VKI40_03085, partial [Terriglobales bacterium]|nr:hypothetical protein [Terriglobales bacterium]